MTAETTDSESRFTGSQPRLQPGCRTALTCAWPALLLALLLLLPFLNTPYTIDDPLYLREAEHALKDPLHPQAFNIVWSYDVTRHASRILPGGVAVPYFLIPTALAGSAEWAGHLTQLLFFLTALVATALLALRLGFGHHEARLAAILTASCPAVLGMAATVMPDIPAMVFVTLGMERLITWRDERRSYQAFIAACWLALAVLTRSHTVLMLAPAFVLLLDGITVSEIRASFRHFPTRFAPIPVTLILVLFVSWLTADPDIGGENIAKEMMRLPGGLHLVVRNVIAFFSHWTLVVPLAIPWLVVRLRRIPVAIPVAGLFLCVVLFSRIGSIAIPVALSLSALADILWVAIKQRDRVRLTLWLWLFPALPVAIYIHLPSKYLLPSAPAVALLLVSLIPQARREVVRWLMPCLAVAGAVLGVLIMLGVRDLALIQRRAVTDLVEPYVRTEKRVWFAGHWGFQWYAEHAGALPVTIGPSGPQTGEIVIVSRIDRPLFAETGIPRVILQRESYPSGGPGRIMDAEAGIGFFSTIWGYLPWEWGSSQSSRFEVWKIK